MDRVTEEQAQGLRESQSFEGLRRFWRLTLAWWVGLAIVLYLAIQTYSGNGWVFPFSWVDLGFHELGHMLTMSWATQPVVAFAGSFLEVLVPMGLSVYFGWRRREMFSAAIMLAWTGEATSGVATYIFDATRRTLPLLGSQDGHDWAYLLGPGVWDALPQTDAISSSVRVLSMSMFLSAVGLLVWGYVRLRIDSRTAREIAAHRATLSVREVPKRRYPKV